MITRGRRAMALFGLGVRAGFDRDQAWWLRSATIVLLASVVTFALVVVWNLPFGLQQRVEVQYERTPWPASALGVASPLIEFPRKADAWVRVMNSRWGDRALQVVHVGASTRVPGPAGVTQLPEPGEIIASPALEALLSSGHRDELASRLPGEVAGTIEATGLMSEDELIAYVGQDVATLHQTGEALGGWGDPSTPPAAMGGSGVVLLGVVAAALALPMMYLLVATGKTLSDRRNKRLASLVLLGARSTDLGFVVAGETVPFVFIGALIGLVGVGLSASPLIGYLPPGWRFLPASLMPGADDIALVAGVLGLLTLAAGRRSARAVADDPLSFRSDVETQRLDSVWVVVWVVGLAVVWTMVQFPESLARGNRLVSGLGFLGVSAALVAVGPMVRVVSLVVARAVARRGTASTGVDLGVNRLLRRGAGQLRASAVVALLLAGIGVAHAVFPILVAAQGSIQGRATENARDDVVIARTERLLDPSELTSLASQLPNARIGSVAVVTASTDDATVEAWVSDCASLHLLLVEFPECLPGRAYMVNGLESDVENNWHLNGVEGSYQPRALSGGVPTLLAFQDLLIVASAGPVAVQGASGFVLLEGVSSEQARDAMWDAPTAFGERGTVATLREMLDDELELVEFYKRSVSVVAGLGLVLAAIGIVLGAVTAALESRRQSAFLWAMGMTRSTRSIANLARSVVPTAAAAIVGTGTGIALGLAYLYFAVGGGEPLESAPFFGYDVGEVALWAGAATAFVVAGVWIADTIGQRDINLSDLRVE